MLDFEFCSIIFFSCIDLLDFAMPLFDDFWETRFNPLRFFLVFLMQIMAVNWFHELCHLAAGLRYGGSGYVMYQMLAFFTVFTVHPTPFGQVVTAFAGGLGAFVFCYLAYTLERNTSVEHRVVWFVVGATQLPYGIVEGVLFYLGYFEHIAILGTAAMLLGAVVSLALCKIMYTSKLYRIPIWIEWK